MTDAEIRIACLNAAVSYSGDHDKLGLAQKWYAWVSEGDDETSLSAEEVRALREQIEQTKITPTKTPFMQQLPKGPKRG